MMTDISSKEEHVQEALYRERVHGETIAALRAEAERLRSWSKSAQEAFERGHRLEDEVERYQTLLRETLEIWHDEEAKLRAENERLRTLLQRLYEWDHMDSAADGVFWRSEIDKVLDNCP